MALSNRSHNVGFDGCTDAWRLLPAIFEPGFYDLKTDGIILAESYELLDQPLELVRYKSSGFRITVIAPDGSVEYDTNADADGMDNHSNRPEVEQAEQTGEGTAVRHSDTIHRDVYYFAQRLEDGSVLRVAKKREHLSVFISALPFLIGLAAVILLACFLLANRLTKRIVRPIDAMAADMDAIEENTVYEELIPFARTIHKQSQLIRSQLEHLEEERGEDSGADQQHMSEVVFVAGYGKTYPFSQPQRCTVACSAGW